MKKIIFICSICFLLIACGKKAEKINARDMAIFIYQKEVLNDETLNDTYWKMEQILESRLKDKSKKEFEMWNKYKEWFSESKRNYSKYKSGEGYSIGWGWINPKFPRLNEVFGDNNAGIDSTFRLYLGRDEESGEKVMKDILTDKAFTGKAVNRNMLGEILSVYRYENGIRQEILEKSKFSYGRLRKMIFYKNGEAYKERNYSKEGEFISEKNL